MCPRCSALYDWRNCIIKKHNGLVESAKCTYVLYPNKPHVSHRDKCKATLMKEVKCGLSYKLCPRKVSVYKSIKSSLERFSQPEFYEKCEAWRKRCVSSSLYTDIYDGIIWKKFQNICDQPFLELPNSLAFILNIDWFNPYKHVVGVIYLVIANLPRSECYKL